MKLKLVVASMSVLGLVSCPVFAAHNAKHKSKHRTAAMKDYKDMGALCTISRNSMIMDGMTQSAGRSNPNPCNPGWFNRIQFSGGMNVDIGKWGNRNANYMGENYQRLSLNDAYLNVAAKVNNWVDAFASISYNTASVSANPAVYNGYGMAEYSAAYDNNISGTATHSVQIEQGYVTISNFDQTPVFVQLGKGFQDFSRYSLHPITRSLTQSMSEVLATSAEVGFITNGFHGALYVFDDPISKSGSSASPANYGVSVGYDNSNDSLGYRFGLGYLYNMIGANDTAYNVVNNHGTTGVANYTSRAGGVALYADVNSGPFMVGARYTANTQRYNVADVTKNGVADITGRTLTGAATRVATATGAKPWSFGLDASYAFEAWGKNQSVYAGYQASREAAGLQLPESRWLVGYNVDMWKNTSFGIEWDHDNAYSFADGGTGNNSNLVSLRSTVKFG